MRRIFEDGDHLFRPGDARPRNGTRGARHEGVRPVLGARLVAGGLSGGRISRDGETRRRNARDHQPRTNGSGPNRRSGIAHRNRPHAPGSHGVPRNKRKGLAQGRDGWAQRFDWSAFRAYRCQRTRRVLCVHCAALFWARRMKSLLIASVAVLLTLVCARAQPAEQPTSAPMPPPIPAPQDRPYPGTIHLDVDATDITRAIFRVHETIPVRGGPIILLFPKWIPGSHGPSGPIDKFAGLVIRAGGKKLSWTRDTVDVYAFHVNVPNGSRVLDCDFQFLSPVETRQGRVVMTPEMLDLEWNAVALYPAGYFSRNIMVQASVKLPLGWKFGTALETASGSGTTTAFKNDFARAFFGIHDGSYVTATYTFDDIVRALNGVLPYNWSQFLRTRLDSVGQPAPLDGITRGGYRLVYTDKPSDFAKSNEHTRKVTDLLYSLGVIVDDREHGQIADVLWDGPAFKAGLVVGSQIVAVNSMAYDPDDLKDAITGAKEMGTPIQLLIRRGDRYSTVSLNYRGGLRYPHLERIPGTPALLDDILNPRH